MTASPLIPDHTLLRPIGRGAYGEVWLARNVMGGLRAVKIIRRGQFDSDRPFEREFAGIQRFEPVSRASGGLVHVLHVGRNDAEGYFYYVMELADDASSPSQIAHSPSPDSYLPRTLRSDLKRLGRLPTPDCLRLALDVVSGLAQLHRQQLVHRDVKPGNIIYVSGRAKLADIGLVNASGEGRTFVGTEGYIPPEGPGSPMADLYALGVVLYEASTSRAPEQFPDVPAEWFFDAAGDEALELHEIILRACEGQRERRYQTADAMQADLALLQSGQSVRHVRALERRYRRLRASGVVGTTLLLCAVVVAGFAQYRARLAAESQVKETALRQQAQKSLARAEAAEQQGRQQLYTALLEQARATVLTAELGQRVLALDAVRRAAAISNSAPLRGVALAALTLPDLRFERELILGAGVTYVQLDPMLERIALFRGGPGPVEIRSAADQRLLATLSASTNLPAFGGVWSRDGHFLAVKRDMTEGGERADWEIWDMAGLRRILLLHDISFGAVSFHPRLPLILAGQHTGTVAVWNLENGLEQVCLPLARVPNLLRFAPDGERIAAFSAIGEGFDLTVYAGTNGVPVASHVFSYFAIEFAWDPTGRWLAVPDLNGAVSVMDAQSGQVRLIGKHKAQAATVEFSPDGAYLFSGGWERELICWDAHTLRRAFTISLNSHFLQMSADGRRCAIFTESAVQLHAFQGPAFHREFAEDLGGRMNFASFSADGRFLAGCGGERLVVWDLMNDGPGAAVSEASRTRLTFAPNGDLFADGQGDCFHWRVAPGTNGASPNLDRRPMPKLEGFATLCVLSTGVVLTAAHGSRLVTFDELSSDQASWKPTVHGITSASRDGRWMGVFPPYSSHLSIYRLPGLEWVATLTNAANISRFEFSPLGDEVAVACRQGVEFWSTATWQRTRHLTNFNGILYAPDGLTCWLTSELRTAGLFDARTAKLLLPLPPGTLPIAVSPDGRRLAVGVSARHVQLWNLEQVREHLRELGLDW